MSEETRNAFIDGATLSNDDHGCLSSWIHLDYGGAGQGFGGYALYMPDSFRHHKLRSVAGHFIWRVMEVAGVSDWSKLKGMPVRAKIVDGIVTEIGHLTEDNWFCPKTEFKIDEVTA